MRRRLCLWLLNKVMGFRSEAILPWPDKCIIALAPHTSNWDFVVGVLFMWGYGVKANFLIKSFWFFWPMCHFMRAIGGIPVYRDKSRSLTDQLAESAIEAKTFHLCITPEGSRSAVTEWRKGFFYIAQKAQIPIIPYGLDFGKHVITSGELIYPEADTTVEEVMGKLKDFFRGMQGKYPDQFAV